MDRDGLAYVHDLFLLMVAAISVSALLVNLSSVYLAREDRNLQSILDSEAGRLCDALQFSASLLQESEHGILNRTALDGSSEASLRSEFKIDGGFSLTIVTATSESTQAQERWTWSDGLPGDEKGTCVTGIAVLFSDGDVRSARATFWIWRL